MYNKTYFAENFPIGEVKLQEKEQIFVTQNFKLDF